MKGSPLLPRGVNEYLLCCCDKKFPDKNQCREEEHLLSGSSRGTESIVEGKARKQDWIMRRPAWQSGGSRVTLHPHTGSREREQEVGSDYKTSKPVPNGRNLLNVP